MSTIIDYVINLLNELEKEQEESHSFEFALLTLSHSLSKHTVLHLVKNIQRSQTLHSFRDNEKTGEKRRKSPTLSFLLSFPPNPFPF